MVCIFLKIPLTKLTDCDTIDYSENTCCRDYIIQHLYSFVKRVNNVVLFEIQEDITMENISSIDRKGQLLPLVHSGLRHFARNAVSPSSSLLTVWEFPKAACRIMRTRVERPIFQFWSVSRTISG